MYAPSTDRLAFEAYAKRLLQEVHQRKDRSAIEIETVFPRYTPNVVISVFQKNREQLVHCGHPTVEKMVDGNYLFVPSVKCSLADGIEVFGMVEPNNLGESIQYTPTKVYVALVNDKLGSVYHLFPSLSSTHRRSFVDNMCKAYATLIKTTEDMVPNYILKSVRSTGANPQTVGPSAFRNVVNQLVQKAWDKEQRLVKSQFHSHQFGNEELECIYRRFKYLVDQPSSGVKALEKSFSVDISVLRSHDRDNNTRISLHGQKCFDAYCSLFKSLANMDKIVAFVRGLADTECDIIQKREMNEEELKTLQETVCYNGFKFNVKREDKVADNALASTLATFFDANTHHSYRYKRRYSFKCDGFNVDLTVVRKGEDKHPVFRPTPFVALEHMRKETDNYEFEIECSASQADNASQCLRWMDECTRAMRKDSFFFGHHVEPVQYPLLLDGQQTKAIVARFNDLVCHGDVRVKQGVGVLNNGVGPNVVNMTHETYSYVCHHFSDYNILMKTDGLRCLAFIDSKQKMMHLFVQNAVYPMSVVVEGVTTDYVLDGELYTKNGETTYFIFDVYQKGKQQLLTKPLCERLDAFVEEVLVVNVKLIVKKKVALFLDRFQELYTTSIAEDNPLQQLKEGFECVDHNGVKANDDGFILMHTGPLVRDLNAEEEEALLRAHGTKPYIMRLAEFQQGTHSISTMSRLQQGAYVFCLKWKPEEECTIDFKVHLMEHNGVVNDNQHKVQLCSKYNTDSELNMYTMIQSLSKGEVSTAICPHTLSNKIQPFQPAEAYDYELTEPVSSGVALCADATNGRIFTERKELVKNNSIVEMRYNKLSGMWTPVRLRTDKTEPNAYSVALANWRNIFNPVPRPLHWVAQTKAYDASELANYYTIKRQSDAISQLDNVHLLLKQHLVLFASRVWATLEPRARLSVYEVGCGKGTDLFHWNYVHKHIRALAFYMGTDYDKSGLMRHDGAYYRYIRGNNGQMNARLQSLENKYAFDAFFAQADACKSLSHCRDHPWDDTLASNNVSKHKLDYELLRYVLFGKTPENTTLAQSFHDGMVHPTYNIVSCQFALHHFASDKHSFWKNLNLLLAVDGLFVATVPNGDFIASQLSKSSTGEYIVPIRNAKNTAVSVPWYKYERGTTKATVFFQTPKISRCEEPLFYKDALLKAVRKDFHVVYLDTFAQYTAKHSLSIYKKSCDFRGVFHSASIDPQTLTHTFQGKHASFARNVHETRDALQYSQEGHYVVVLCKKSGRSVAEVEALRKHFV